MMVDASGATCRDPEAVAQALLPCDDANRSWCSRAQTGMAWNTHRAGPAQGLVDTRREAAAGMPEIPSTTLSRLGERGVALEGHILRNFRKYARRSAVPGDS